MAREVRALEVCVLCAFEILGRPGRLGGEAPRGRQGGENQGKATAEESRHGSVG
jgi:hypothetical protein